MGPAGAFKAMAKAFVGDAVLSDTINSVSNAASTRVTSLATGAPLGDVQFLVGVNPGVINNTRIEDRQTLQENSAGYTEINNGSKFLLTTVMGLILGVRRRGGSPDAPRRTNIFNRGPDYTGRGTGITYKVFRRDIDPNYTYRGVSNLDRMRNGDAPYVIGANGRPQQVQLHHSRQDAQGPLFEITAGTHRTRRANGGAALHPYPNRQHPDRPVNRDQFRIDRRDYWRQRASGLSGN
jgi:hypothetical protein